MGAVAVAERRLLGGSGYFHRTGDLPDSHDVEGSADCSLCRVDTDYRHGASTLAQESPRRDRSLDLDHHWSFGLPQCSGEVQAGNRPGGSLDHQSLSDLEISSPDDGRCLRRLGDWSFG